MKNSEIEALAKEFMNKQDNALSLPDERPCLSVGTYKIRKKSFKKSFITVVAVLLLLVTAGSVFATNAINARSDSDVEKLYSDFLKEKQNMNDEQQRSSFLNLLSVISTGEESEAGKYAKILRELTNGEYDFEDDEVFTVAKELSDIYNAMGNGEVTVGVQAVKFSKKGGKPSVTIEYIECRKYLVEAIENPAEETIFNGERAEKYDGSLGKNLIKITLLDSRLSSAWLSEHSAYTVYVLNGKPFDAADAIKYMACFNNDHAVLIYIGSDSALEVNEAENVSIGSIYGKIELELTIK